MSKARHSGKRPPLRLIGHRIRSFASELIIPASCKRHNNNLMREFMPCLRNRVEYLCFCVTKWCNCVHQLCVPYPRFSCLSQRGVAYAGSTADHSACDGSFFQYIDIYAASGRIHRAKSSIRGFAIWLKMMLRFLDSCDNPGVSTS